MKKKEKKKKRERCSFISAGAIIQGNISVFPTMTRKGKRLAASSIICLNELLDSLTCMYVFFSISFLFFTSFISFFYTHVKSVVFFILMYTGALPQYAPVYDGCLSIPPAYVWEPERRPIAEPFVEEKRKGKGSKY